MLSARLDFFRRGRRKMANEQIQIGSGEENRFIDNRRSNVKSDLIEITEDKLEIILMKHIERMQLRKRWLLPLGFLVSVVLTLTTAQFNDSLGLKADVWHAFFLLLAIGSGIWLVVDLITLIRCWGKSTLDYLISQI